MPLEQQRRMPFDAWMKEHEDVGGVIESSDSDDGNHGMKVLRVMIGRVIVVVRMIIII